ncbi:MAG TPA: hypothetical protein VKB65_04660 [Myxococcota bacterium]|nr:hypothetical protein [Myxococcota bacterium]
MPDGDDPPRPRKDRLIQTRVPRELETTLKEEARRRRLTVSHLIRSVLEDAFDLVDGVVADAEEIVHDSARLARNVSRNARRLASPGRERAAPARPTDGTAPGFPHVYAWNELVLNRAVRCSGCDAEIARGERGFLGLGDEPDATPPCLCPRCVAALPAEPAP